MPNLGLEPGTEGLFRVYFELSIDITDHSGMLGWELDVGAEGDPITLCL